MMNSSPQPPTPIVHVAYKDALGSGRIHKLFRAGARAVVLHDLPMLAEAWSRLCDSTEPPDGPPPWQNSYVDVARNHYPSRGFGEHMGDTIAFDPGGINYIARKVRVSRPSVGDLTIFPASFSHGAEAASFPADLASEALSFAQEIAQSALGDPTPVPKIAVTIERLKYVVDHADLDRVHALVASAAAQRSSGRYQRLGKVLDVLLDGLNTRLDHTMQAVAQRSNLGILEGTLRRARLARKLREVPSDARVIGGTHIDHRLLVALSSRRHALRTELFDGKSWHALDLSADTLALMPCRDAARFALSPTWHRVLQVTPQGGPTPNLTLCFGIELAS